MKTDDLIQKSELCCGCGACACICPKKAITLKTDESGSAFPVIDDELCVNCKQCILVCPIKNDSSFFNSINGYAAVSRNPSLLEEAASGGAFSSIARKAIEEGWCVSGVVSEFDHGKNNTYHLISDSLSDIEKFQGSKYVQSDCQKVFSKIRTNLIIGKSVLFSGTPCQVDALYHYLRGICVDNLYTIDIICHGVPGNDIFNNYLEILEEYLNGEIYRIGFRNKEISGWGLKGIVEYYKNGKKKRSLLIPKFSSYYRMFLDAVIYRDSCYECKYAREQRVSDITIGDYWGIESEHPELCNRWNVSKGISCVITNTPKGQDLLTKFGCYLDFRDSSAEKIAKHNGQLVAPSKRNDRANEIKKILYYHDYRTVEKMYYKNHVQKLAIVIWYKLPFWMQVKLMRAINIIKD